MNDEDVQKWMKTLNRKGPFYLYRVSEEKSINHYFVIWNDKRKTKYGYLSDGMYCRYGIRTICVLNGDTTFDLWNGQAVSSEPEIFDEMLKVRNKENTLPIFKLENLKDLKH